jgi:hypothetical protein
LWVKPPSSDAEALRSEQSAPVCAKNRLFVATNEPGHLASVQQPVRQPLRLVGRRLLGDSIVDPSSSGYEYEFLMASSEDPPRPAPRSKGGEATTSAQGVAPATVRTPMLLGNDEPGGPARE